MKLLMVLIILLFLFSVTFACGCGIALGPTSMVNNLKESNALLIVDAQRDSGFYLKPYFRFVSLENDENVTLVFPLKALPDEFNAEKMTVSEFKKREGIDAYNSIKQTQTWDGFSKKFASFNIAPLVLYSVGFGGSVVSIIPAAFLYLGVFNVGSRSPEVAHYTFEGGSLDIYESSAQGTLGELTGRLGMQYEGKLAELVEKYKDNYVAVLNLHITTPLPKEQMDYFKQNCNDMYLESKNLLKQKTEINLTALPGYRTYGFEYRTGWQIPSNTSTLNRFEKERLCSVLAFAFVSNAAGANQQLGRSGGFENDPEGVLLSMKFSSSDEVFYPVSVVESYNYPVANQQYFVRVPLEKEFKFSSSWASQTALIGDRRWYEVKNTNEDLEGTIGPAGMETVAKDYVLRSWAFLYQTAFLVSMLLYIVTVFLIWKLLKRRQIDMPIHLLVIGGAFYLAYRLWRKNRDTAYVVLGGILVWIILCLL